MVLSLGCQVMREGPRGNRSQTLTKAVETQYFMQPHSPRASARGSIEAPLHFPMLTTLVMTKARSRLG